MIEGESRRDEFLPRLLVLHVQGCFPFGRMLRRHPFVEINAAMVARERGEAGKPVLAP